ncbi:MAG TPA: hypothetical protein PLE77_05300 [Kiritimatiellia bacterium]|nr:hypothetical protein [Kiritimatiellia bacterium]
MVKVFSKGRLLAAVMIALSVFHAVVVWLSSYSRGDCDDKAVHYYSSSYVLAAAPARAAVLDTLPAWLEKLPASRKKVRLENRILSAWNYPAADVAIGMMRAMTGGRFTRAVKLAMLLLFCAALIWLVIAAGVLDRGRLLVAAVLLIGASSVLIIPPWLSLPRFNMNPFTAYVPRGSACFLVLGVMLAAAARRPWLVCASALLVAAWHTAFALLVLPMVAIGVLFGGLQTRTETLPTFKLLGWLLPGLALAAGVAMLGWGVTMGGAGRVPVSMTSAVLASCGWSVLLLAAVIAVWLWSGWSGPLGVAYDRLLLSVLGFLLCIKLFLLTHGVMQVLTGTGDIGGVYLASQIPMRLGGVDYLHGILLVVLAAWMLAARVAMRWPRARRLMIAAAVVLLVLAAWVRRDAYACLVPGHGTIWNEICDVQPRDDVTAETLPTLDPADEPAFFRDIGEFLFRSR